MLYPTVIETSWNVTSSVVGEVLAMWMYVMNWGEVPARP